MKLIFYSMVEQIPAQGLDLSHLQRKLELKHPIPFNIQQTTVLLPIKKTAPFIKRRFLFL
jgi:hypothetical protein